MMKKMKMNKNRSHTVQAFMKFGITVDWKREALTRIYGWI